MKSICVFAASNSSNSINQKLALYAAEMVGDVKIDLLDLNDFEVPIYSPQRQENGIPTLIDKFNDRLAAADGLLISFAEYNGSYSPAFKNIFDWNSRREGDKGWTNKPVLLLSTSPGGRGGASVLGTAKTSFPHFGMKVSGAFSLPNFHNNFAPNSVSGGMLVGGLLKNSLLQEIQNFSNDL